MKYVVDTNVISEVLKERPCENVINWFHDFNEDVLLPSVSVEEMYYGVLIMPDGRRKRALKEVVNGIVKDCASRTLPYDGFSAYLCAQLHAKARGMGRSSSIEDYMIAAICQRNDAILATHNVKDFDYLGVELVDPFTYESPALKRLQQRKRDREAGR